MRQIAAVTLAILREILRKKDFYVLFILMAAFLCFLSSQTFFGIGGTSRHVIDIGYSLAIFFSVVIAAVTGARQLPAEIQSKTIYPLLAKPVSRRMVIISIFFGSLSAAVICFTFFFAVFSYFYSVKSAATSFVLLGQSYLFGILLMAMVASVSVFFSNFMTLASNVTITLLFYISVSALSGIIRDAYIFSRGFMAAVTGFFYYIIPHFEFYDLRTRIVHGWSALPFSLVLSVTLYTALYCIGLLCVSGAVFKRRSL